MNILLALLLIGLLLIMAACTSVTNMIPGTDLTEYVTKQCGTEPPFKNAYWDEHRAGIYVDANTKEPLFSSLDKFDSGTGWPSFTKSLDTASIEEKEDTTAGMSRTEVRTNASHLGHVFDDGPNGGDRYCINSAALEFIPYKELEQNGLGEYKSLFSFEEATFGAGCFWGVEHILKDIKGITETTTGYMGGTVENPTYSKVSNGNTGYAEVVHVLYDPAIVSYAELLDYFWRLHDPTQENRQGLDVGTQYRSVILYYTEEQRIIAEQSKKDFDAKEVFKKPVVTEIVPAQTFYPAEDYHQDYYDVNTNKRVCHTLRKE